jgi:hypothetical protein
MLEPSFLDSRAASMESLLRAYLAVLPTSFVDDEGPAALRTLLGQSALATAGICDTPAGTPAGTPRSTMSGLLKGPTSVYSTIHEETGKPKQAGQTDLVREACKKVLFEGEAETKTLELPSPVRAACIAQPSPWTGTARLMPAPA